MKTSKAIVAGLTGGIAMTILGFVVRQMGIDMNAEMMLGTMLVSPAGTTAWIVGLMIHLMLSVIFALIYAWGFERLTHRAGIAVGLGFAVVHIIFAGIAMTMIPAMHPGIPEMMMAPAHSCPAWVPWVWDSSFWSILCTAQSSAGCTAP